MRRACLFSLILLVLLAGCSRRHYRTRADADAYGILQRKTAQTPWSLPYDYDIVPSPASRLYDPTPLEDPLLPPPAPQLYAYDLPDLPQRDPNRFRPTAPGTVPEFQIRSPADGLVRLPPIDAGLPFFDGRVVPASHAATAAEPVRLATLRWLDQPPEEPAEPPAGPPPPGAAAARPSRPPGQQTTYGVDLIVMPIPPTAWQTVPASCRLRMLEFQSIRDEYQLSYGQEPGADQLDQAQRLSLEDIVDLALLNNRAYQTEKEILYRVALRLSLERFDYDLKFSTGGNRGEADFTHNRNDGITVNRLGLPVALQGDKMLLTGSDLLVRLANDLLLTFNGPRGFAVDVGSDLLLDITHTVFQRDMRFERLTQAERDVVYAARDFLRFRKTLFVELTRRYYDLLISYRQIEIESQNYFTLVRAFDQQREEWQKGFVARFLVDQVEQDLLGARRRLIGQCTALEAALDGLKVQIGLPTETPLNLDLGELEDLTLRDELAVAGELIRRVQDQLQAQRDRPQPDRVELLSASISLVQRILRAFDLQQRLGGQPPDTQQLEALRLRMRIETGREAARESLAGLAQELAGDDPNLTTVFQRTRDVVDLLLVLLERQLDYVPQSAAAAQLDNLREQLNQLESRSADLHRAWDALIAEGRLDELQELVTRAAALRTDAQQLVDQIDGLLGITPPPPERALDETKAIVDGLLAYSATILPAFGGGLVPVDIGVDDAMLTAVVLRLDLMNRRGELADLWRRIKLAGDDLKSVLDLNVNQTIRREGTRPYDFTFDESRTQLRATLDPPLNRRAQRNSYRQALIDYQVALRVLMNAEDLIKQDVRDDLRDLALEREQYVINVASAALSSDRVVSTALQLQLGVGSVTPRDFLESQRAYTGNVSDVARGHINYIRQRMTLFLDLELLQLDEGGFWNELYDEQYQPEPYYQLPPHALPAYGALPHGLMFSPAIKRMLNVPTGVSMIHGQPSQPPDDGEPRLLEEVPPAPPYVEP